MKSKTSDTLIVAIMCVAMVLAANWVLAQEALDSKPIPSAHVDQASRAKADAVARELFKAWAASQFEPLSDDFTSEMKQAFPPDVQKQFYATIKANFGDFKDIQFAEAVTSPAFPRYIVYRFRADFSDTPARPEVRVVLDKDKKVGGFAVKLWNPEVK
ncbi:MAG: DUF3887 domain-containing protein [Desulfomonilaceae bacterium]